MSRATEPIDTVYGECKFTVCECDHCGAKCVAESSYPNEGWVQTIISERKDGRSFSDQIRKDYCGGECLLRSYIPDVFDETSAVSRRTVERLKRIVSELG